MWSQRDVAVGLGLCAGRDCNGAGRVSSETCVPVSSEAEVGLVAAAVFGQVRFHGDGRAKNGRRRLDPGEKIDIGSGQGSGLGTCAGAVSQDENTDERVHEGNSALGADIAGRNVDICCEN